MTHYALNVPDKTIVKDGVGLRLASNDTWLNDYSSIHAIQINDSSGEVEPTSGENRSATEEEIKAVKDKYDALNKAKEDAETSWQNNWDRVRLARNHLLLDTDWTVMTDSPLSNDKKQEYITYRSNLRNIPQTYSSNNAKDIEFGDGYVSVSGSKKIIKPT